MVKSLIAMVSQLKARALIKALGGVFVLGLWGAPVVSADLSQSSTPLLVTAPEDGSQCDLSEATGASSTEPRGSWVQAATSCPPGTYYSSGYCIPGGADHCGGGSYCTGGQCMPGGGCCTRPNRVTADGYCVPSGASYCGGGRYCTTGVCVQTSTGSRCQ